MAAVGSVDPGLAFRYAPVFVIVLGDPRTIDAYPVRTKLEKWESHFYSSLANCVLQLMLVFPRVGTHHDLRQRCFFTVFLGDDQIAP